MQSWYESVACVQCAPAHSGLSRIVRLRADHVQAEGKSKPLKRPTQHNIALRNMRACSRTASRCLGALAGSRNEMLCLAPPACGLVAAKPRRSFVSPARPASCVRVLCAPSSAQAALTHTRPRRPQGLPPNFVSNRQGMGNAQSSLYSPIHLYQEINMNITLYLKITFLPKPRLLLLFSRQQLSTKPSLAELAREAENAPLGKNSETEGTSKARSTAK